MNYTRATRLEKTGVVLLVVGLSVLFITTIFNLPQLTFVVAGVFIAAGAMALAKSDDLFDNNKEKH